VRASEQPAGTTSEYSFWAQGLLGSAMHIRCGKTQYSLAHLLLDMGSPLAICREPKLLLVIRDTLVTHYWILGGAK
jgi:hypothetical protein